MAKQIEGINGGYEGRIGTVIGYSLARVVVHAHLSCPHQRRAQQKSAGAAATLFEHGAHGVATARGDSRGNEGLRYGGAHDRVQLVC